MEIRAGLLQSKPMIPHSITKDHISEAVAETRRGGVPARRNSKKYRLIVASEEYPPKYIISRASFFATHEEFSWEDFNAVEAINYLLRRGYKITDGRGNDVLPDPEPEADSSSFPEGLPKYRLHRYLERDGKLIRDIKRSRLKEDNKLRCEVCQFSFSERYGEEFGVGFIEAHHTVPIAQIRAKRKTLKKEIVMVCSNCHRMLHRVTFGWEEFIKRFGR